MLERRSKLGVAITMSSGSTAVWGISPGSVRGPACFFGCRYAPAFKARRNDIVQNVEHSHPSWIKLGGKITHKTDRTEYFGGGNTYAWALRFW